VTTTRTFIFNKELPCVIKPSFSNNNRIRTWHLSHHGALSTISTTLSFHSASSSSPLVQRKRNYKKDPKPPHPDADIYIYIIYTPNLGFPIAVPGREREQGRFRGSTEGARESTGEYRREQRGAAQGSFNWQHHNRLKLFAFKIYSIQLTPLPNYASITVSMAFLAFSPSLMSSPAKLAVCVFRILHYCAGINLGRYYGYTPFAYNYTPQLPTITPPDYLQLHPPALG